MVERDANVANIGQDVSIALDSRAGNNLGPQRYVGDAAPSLPHAFEGRDGDLGVGIGGVA